LLVGERVSVDELYNALLRYYRGSTIWGDPRAKLESDIAKLVEKGFTREEAIKKLFEEKIGDYRVIAERRAAAPPALEGAKLVYKGERVGIVYVETDPFYDSLPRLGRVLDEVEERFGEVIAVVPNVGFVTASVFLGTSFQGVKGVAVVFRLRRSEPEQQGEHAGGQH
jgi:hypothetical protein